MDLDQAQPKRSTGQLEAKEAISGGDALVARLLGSPGASCGHSISVGVGLSDLNRGRSSSGCAPALRSPPPCPSATSEVRTSFHQKGLAKFRKVSGDDRAICNLGGADVVPPERPRQVPEGFGRRSGRPSGMSTCHSVRRSGIGWAGEHWPCRCASAPSPRRLTTSCSSRTSRMGARCSSRMWTSPGSSAWSSVGAVGLGSGPTSTTALAGQLLLLACVSFATALPCLSWR